MHEKVRQAFFGRFGSDPDFVVRAPGRVNLIGEHTDYNDGYVMPLAIEQGTWIALRRRLDPRVCLHSLNFGSDEEVDLQELEAGREEAGWGSYLRGVAWAMSSRYACLNGWEGVAGSTLPIGAGLSSSASFELALARAFAVAASVEWEPKRMAVICHKAEVEWVGLHCGWMDHLVSAAGREGHALLIDCRSLEGRAIPLPADAVVVVMDTAKSRTLTGSAFNERRTQCEKAAGGLGLPSLRDASPQILEEARRRLDPLLYSRARHVICENERTLEAAAAMEAGELARLGELMNASHESLRVDYEVSSAELDAMVEAAQAAPGCIGARMTGAGFGGCAVALVETDLVEAFLGQVRSAYTSATGLVPRLYVTHAAAGASCEPVGEGEIPEPAN